MTAEMESKLELFLKNYDIISEKYRFEYHSMVSLAALMFTADSKEADTDRIEDCRDLLKGRAGMFSNMRGMMLFPLAAKMATMLDPEAYLEGVRDAYAKLVRGRAHVNRTVFDVTAAVILHESRIHTDIDTTAVRVGEIYRKMKTEHPLLTGREDMASATMLAVSGKDEDMLLAEMETCWNMLKPDFPMSGNELQTVCAMLATDQRPAETKAARVCLLSDGLKQLGYRMRMYHCFSLLGALSLIDGSPAEIAGAVDEIARRLKGHKGFGALSQGKSGRLMCAMMLYMDCRTNWTKDTPMQASLTTVILVQIITMINTTTIVTST